MKKILSVIFVLCILFACSDDEPEVVQGGDPPNIDTITYDVGAITSSSVVIEFTSNSFTSSGGSLIREIWFKRPEATDWSIKDITDAPSEQLQHLVDGLDFATRYTIKAVFTVGELVRESSETSIVTLPFETTARKDGFEQIVLISQDMSVDFQALASDPTFYLKYANDSIPMALTKVSKDTLLIDFQADNAIFFADDEGYVDKFTAPISYQLQDYYEKEWKTLEIFNRKPKIDAQSAQTVVNCTGEDHTKLAFSGLFWNATDATDILLEAEEYAITIQNVQNASIATPVFVKNDEIADVANACESGFSILPVDPITNRFHSGRELWISFETNLLPEGTYQLQFSALYDGVTYTADPFNFELTYE